MPFPVDVLVEEHRLILRAVDAIKKESEKIQRTKAANPIIITVAVDFFRTYADRFHHGKEEGILFSELSRKVLADADREMMTELINEACICEAYSNCP